MSARDVIAHAIDLRLSMVNAKITADAILDDLTAAGYRILAPGELDGETIERCVKAVNGDKMVQGLVRARMVIALRSLSEPKP